MGELDPNSAAPSPTFLGGRNSVEEFLKPERKSRIVGFLIGFSLPIALMIIVLLILLFALLNIGEDVREFELLGYGLLGLLFVLTVVPITSLIIVIRAWIKGNTDQAYGAGSVLMIWIVVIFYFFTF